MANDVSGEAQGSRYLIGTWQQQPGQQGGTCRGVEHIDAEAYHELVEVVSAYRALTERTSFALIRRSHHALRGLQSVYSNLARLSGQMRNVNQRSLVTLFAHESLNWLVATRFYLELESKILGSIFGEDSAEAREFVAATHVAYDEHFPGYGLMYKLRDFAQHGGQPISGIDIRAREGRESEVVPYLSRESALSAHFNWTSRLEQELANGEAKIDLMPLVDDAMLGLEHIEAVVVGLHAKNLAGRVGSILDVLARIGDQDGKPALFRFPPASESGQLGLELLPDASSLRAVREHGTSGVPLHREAEVDPFDSLTAPQQASGQKASAAMALLLDGATDAFVREVQEIVRGDNGNSFPLIAGLADLARTAVIMTAGAVGSTPESLLGSLTPGPVA